MSVLLKSKLPCCQTPAWRRTSTTPRPCTASTSSSLERRVVACSSKQGGEVVTQKALENLKQALSGASAADPAYVDGANYLRSIGLTNAADVARVLDVAMNPNSLFVSFKDYKRSKNASARPLTVEGDMKPVVEFLLSKGVAVGDVAKIISKHPPVLSYSVEGRLEPFWTYLQSIGVQDVCEAVLKRPSLLGLDVDNNLRKIVDYLQYVETPTETVVKYIVESI